MRRWLPDATTSTALVGLVALAGRVFTARVVEAAGSGREL